MSKEETSRRLASKMVRFVRNPTVNWVRASITLRAERGRRCSKQMLKEMIERNGRGDFVRREFDQRKLRRRDALTGQRTGAPHGAPLVLPQRHDFAR